LYKVMIVDDEVQSREIMASYISEYKEDFEIAAVLQNGKRAIEFLEKNDVDIVLTDIKMPYVDGIELSKWIHENKPSIKVVLVSAFAEFEYAKLALLYNVIYYLLKAIDEEELKTVLYHIKDVLDSERAAWENNIKDELEEGFYEQLCCEDNKNEAFIRKKYEFLQTEIPYEDAYVTFVKGYIENINLILSNKYKYGQVSFEDMVSNIAKYSSDVVKTNVFFLTPADFLIAVISDKEHTGEVCKIEEALIQILKFEFKWKELGEFCLRSMAQGEDGKSIAELFKMSVFKKCSNSKMNDAISKAEKYLHENYSKDISRDELAEYLGLNPMYVSRLFKEKLNTTFSEYLLNVRMQKAIKLMREGKKNTDIYSKVGYTNLRQFRRAFKLFSGYTISDYKKTVLRISDYEF